jgi:hypothetical protein
MATPQYNTNIPVYEEPDLETPNVTIDPEQIKQSSQFITSDATVSGQMTGLLNQNSKYMQAARNSALEGMNSKGLLNSNLAVGASQGAAIRESLPIATADADTFRNLQLNQEKTYQDSLSTNQTAQLENIINQNKSRITGALSEQEIAGSLENTRLSNLGAYDRQVLTEEMANLRQQIDAQMKVAVSDDQFESEERKQLAAIIGSQQQELTGSIERILRDTNIQDAAAKTAAIAAVKQQFQSNAMTAAAIFGLNLSWS